MALNFKDVLKLSTAGGENGVSHLPADKSTASEKGDNVKQTERKAKRKQRSCGRTAQKPRAQRVQSSPAGRGGVRVSMTPNSTSLYDERAPSEQTTISVVESDTPATKTYGKPRRVNSAGYIDTKYTVCNTEYNAKRLPPNDFSNRRSRSQLDSKLASTHATDLSDLSQMQSKLETVHVGSEVLRTIACYRHSKYNSSTDRYQTPNGRETPQKTSAFPVVRLRTGCASNPQSYVTSGRPLQPGSSPVTFKYSHLFQRKINPASNGGYFLRGYVTGNEEFLATRAFQPTRPAVNLLKKTLIDKITVHGNRAPLFGLDGSESSATRAGVPSEPKSILKQPRQSGNRKRLSVQFTIPTKCDAITTSNYARYM